MRNREINISTKDFVEYTVTGCFIRIADGMIRIFDKNNNFVLEVEAEGTEIF